jgi:hypothetical protein
VAYRVREQPASPDARGDAAARDRERSRRAAVAPASPASKLLALQQTVGNAAVQRAVLQRKFTVEKKPVERTRLPAAAKDSVLIQEWADYEHDGPDFGTWEEVHELARASEGLMKVFSDEDVAVRRRIGLACLVISRLEPRGVADITTLVTSGRWFGEMAEWLGRMQSPRNLAGLWHEFMIAREALRQQPDAVVQIGALDAGSIKGALTQFGLEGALATFTREVADERSDKKRLQGRIGGDLVVWYPDPPVSGGPTGSAPDTRPVGPAAPRARFIQAKNVKPNKVVENLRGAARQLAGLSASGEGAIAEAETALTNEAFAGEIHMTVNMFGDAESGSDVEEWERQARSLIVGRLEGRAGERNYVTSVTFTYLEPGGTRTKVITAGSELPRTGGAVPAILQGLDEPKTPQPQPRSLPKPKPQSQLLPVFAEERGEIMAAYEKVDEDLRGVLDDYWDAPRRDPEARADEFRKLIGEARGSPRAPAPVSAKRSPKRPAKGGSAKSKQQPKGRIVEPPAEEATTIALPRPDSEARLVKRIEACFRDYKKDDNCNDGQWWADRIEELFTL